METTLIEKNGREYWIGDDKKLYNSKEKFIGWLDNGVYVPSNDIQVKRNRIDSEARKRLNKAKFEESVKKRMNELSKFKQ